MRRRPRKPIAQLADRRPSRLAGRQLIDLDNIDWEARAELLTEVNKAMRAYNRLVPPIPPDGRLFGRGAIKRTRIGCRFGVGAIPKLP